MLVARHEGASQARSLGSDALDALEELGVRLSDVLSADRLLLVEGPTDEALLRVWFPEELANQRVAVVNAVGGDNARYARHLRTWLAEADLLGDRRDLFLRDRDELSEADIKSLEAGGFVCVPLRREIENYLLDAAALADFVNTKLAGRKSRLARFSAPCGWSPMSANRLWCSSASAVNWHQFALWTTIYVRN